MFKKFLTLGSSLALVLGMGLIASPASAADGEQFLPGGGLPTAGGLLTDVSGVSTDFTRAAVLDHPANYSDQNTGSMYDPGYYTVGYNPASLHEFWADWSGNTNLTLFVNGFVGEQDQLVWRKSVATEPCTVVGSTVSFTFSANAANIVDPAYIPEFDDGGIISVTINGVSIGSANLSGTSAEATISITGLAPVTDGTLDVAIWNNGQAYSGNDFGISNLSLIQNGECIPPVVGGLTIGYYKNHAVSEATWDAARVNYPILFAGLPNWSDALAVLNAKPTDDGKVQLLRQAIAFALNVETIDGFADNVVGGMSAEDYLQYLDTTPSAWDTRAERLAIAAILDAANQHVV